MSEIYKEEIKSRIMEIHDLVDSSDDPKKDGIRLLALGFWMLTPSKKDIDSFEKATIDLVITFCDSLRNRDY